ncbi:MAG: DPP IV N-terminal domain-containing protein, partial [Deltaproteobacteria bacterium]
MPTLTARRTAAAFVFVSVAGASIAHAQDRLKSMPGYERYQRMAPLISTALGGTGRGFGRGAGGGGVTWSADGKSVEFANGGKRYRMDLATKKIAEATDTVERQMAPRGRGGFPGAPARGRQFEAAIAPAGNHRALYRDRNVWIGDSTGANAVQITTEGSVQSRIKFGTASWVYGEELGQRTAMWWSPDGKKLAYYRFDESKVPDFYLTPGLTGVQDTLDVEAYPKPGVPNPVVDLFVYDVDSKKTTRLDVRDGKPLDNDVVGYYVFHVDWSPDGRELVFLRANRRQNTLELAACNPDTGACRTVIHESWPTGWIDDDPAPTPIFLKDGNRFIWESGRNGFNNYYLYDFKAGKLITPLTQLQAEVAGVVRVDEATNSLYYTARDGDNYMKFQLHRVRLDGANERRLTDPAFTHTVSLA